MKDVKFTCYRYKHDSGVNTLFLFYNWDGDCWVWDEWKLLIEDAVKFYPPHEYNWLYEEDF